MNMVNNKEIVNTNHKCTCTSCSTSNTKIICGLGYKKPPTGKWTNYSVSMMECSVCGKHVAKRKFEYCPHCGSAMTREKTKLETGNSDNWEQLTVFDYI